LALHNYESVHGHLPPAAVCGPDGQPLLSWRVLILPYISQEELYDQFKLDEPWDSEHNRRLLERMPKTYEAPWTKYVDVPPNHTVLHVFVGPGTAFEPGKQLKLSGEDFPDGTSNTLGVVEAGDPVPWTKPEEITFVPGQTIRLRGLFRNGFRAGSLDGSHRLVPHDYDPDALQASVTRNGGEPITSGLIR
jgi:hypothetical protein